MPATNTYPPETIARARRQYQEGRPVEDIVKEAGACIGTVYKWLAGDVPGMQLPRIPRRRPGVRRLRPTKRLRTAVVTRLWHAAARQAREIEARLANQDLTTAGSERDARTLSVLVRTLKELTAMDENDARQSAEEANAHDDDVRDIDEFRRDLARQMDAIIARRADRAPGKPEQT
jgi:hypothetical protein